MLLEATNDIAVSNNRIKEVEDPVEDQDAVNLRFLEEYTSGGTFLYSNPTPMPEEVGGYEAGDTFSDATLQQLFTNLLYPYQYPAISSFTMTGQPTIIEVGDSVAGGQRSFSWSITNGVNIATNSIQIEDVTNGVVYGSTYANDSQETIDIGAAITKTSAASNQWRFTARNTKNQSISRTFNVYWRWKTYYGTSTKESLTEADIKALASTSLDSNFTGNKTVAANDYKYFAYPTAFGLKSTFKDVVNGFAIAMEPATTITITNDFGVSTDYYVHRTTNPIIGSLTIAVS